MLSAGIVGSVKSCCCKSRRVGPRLGRILRCVHLRCRLAEVSLKALNVYCHLNLARLSLEHGGGIGCDVFHGCKDTVIGLIAYSRDRFTEVYSGGPDGRFTCGSSTSRLISGYITRRISTLPVCCKDVLCLLGLRLRGGSLGSGLRGSLSLFRGFCG